MITKTGKPLVALRELIIIHEKAKDLIVNNNYYNYY